MKRYLKHRPITRFLILLLTTVNLASATIARAAAPVPITAKTPLIVVTDVLPDDVEALLVLSEILASSKGRDLLIVTSDGQVQSKAQAVHNLMFLLNLAQSKVTAGAPNDLAAAEFPYTEPYLDDNAKQFLASLTKYDGGASPWKSLNYKTEIQRFLQSHDNTTVLLLASPQSLVDSLNPADRSRIQQIFGMGLWKLLTNGSWITAYNTNIAVESVRRLLTWVKETGTPLFMLPSQLFEGLDPVSSAIEAPRQAFFSSPIHGGIMKNVISGLTAFRDLLGSILFRKHGALAPFVQLWDPQSQAWMQDGVSVAVAVDPTAARWTPVNAEIEMGQKQPLGYPVTVTPGEGPIYVAERLDLAKVATTLRSAYSGARVAPEFSAQAAFSAGEQPPIGVITKSAIDDIGMLRLLLGLSASRLKLVIAESTQTPLIAAALRKILAGYGRSDVAVVAGHGQTLAELEKIPAMSLELKLLREGLLTRGVISETEREALMKLDPSQLSAEAELSALLENNPKVDLIDAASIETLYEVLNKKPYLAEKIRHLHLMGGWRGGTTDEKGGVRGGSLTRNWVLTPEKTRKLLELLNDWHMKTFIYSSHLAGGSLTAASLPESIRTFEAIREHEVEKEINRLRINWNEGLLALKGGKGIDVNGNYGPPLAWLMGVREALGENADQYFSTTAGKLTFDGEKVDFSPEAASSIFLVDEAKTYHVLDKSIAHLSQMAATRIPQPGFFGRAAARCGRLFRRAK